METNNKEAKKSREDGEQESADPVKVIREGAVAASIWKRQSPAGYPYYDFSLSRSWKSLSSGKTGYSKNFFDNNKAELLLVIEAATQWIAEQGQGSKESAPEALAA